MPNSLLSTRATKHAAPTDLNEPGDLAQFVRWLRAVAPYLHAFRGKTFVIGAPGELFADGHLTTLVQDLALLQVMGMKIVLVHGSRPQVQQQLDLKGVPSRFADGIRITDAASLECAKEASGELRLDIEAAFSQALPNTPMGNARVRVVSGNFVVARPVGIVQGVDFEHTGIVRKVETDIIKFALDAGAVVLMSSLGFSPTGDAFNLAMEDVAAAVAVALDADKLVYLTEVDALRDDNGLVVTEMSEADAQRRLDAKTLQAEQAYYLNHALKACRGGVARAHLVPYQQDGSLLLEVFTHDGVGSMVVEEALESLRDATLDDVAAIVSLIEPLERDGTFVPRGRTAIERDIDHFVVIQHDGVIFGCAALYAYPHAKIGEMACLMVSQSTQNKGDGERLLRCIEQRARAQGLDRLFVLTTRTSHWFQKRGFAPATIEDLPAERQQRYDWARRSQILIKRLA